MKKILFILLLLTIILEASAQYVLKSKVVYSTNQNETVNSVDLGFKNNLLSAHSFFDLTNGWTARFVRTPLNGASSTTLTFGNTGIDEGAVMKYNNKGHIYAIGNFSGSVNFSNTTFWSTSIHSPNGKGIFLAKYDTFAIPYAAFAVGITPNAAAATVVLKDATVDTAGNLYIVGDFKGGAITFGGSGGVKTAATYGSVFFAKYNAAGVAQWVKQIDLSAFPGMNRYISLNAIAVDSLGYVYLAGHMDGTVDIDPDAGVVSTLGLGGTFIGKYAPNGAYVRGYRISDGVNLGEAYDISVKGSMVYITGKYGWSNADFDFSAATVTPPDGLFNGNMYLAKYDTAFNYQFVKAVTGTSIEYGKSLDIDNSGNIVIAIQHNGAVEMNPTGTSMPITHSGGYDAIIAKYNDTGRVISADKFAGAGNDYINSIVTTPTGDSVVIGGSFTSIINFGLSGTASNSTSAGGSDAFFAIYSPSPLSVSISALHGKIQDAKTALLNWITYSEKDNEGFVIEKSTDGKTFAKIGFVVSTHEKGSATVSSGYEFIDYSFDNTTSYYRLKQMDYDGQYTYSNIVVLSGSNKTSPINIYPNPTTGTLHINGFKNQAIVELYDIRGVKVMNKNVTDKAPIVNIEHLTDELYMIRISDGAEIITQQKIFLKR